MHSARPPPVRQNRVFQNEAEYYERGDRLKQSKNSSYDELPLFFNAETVAAVLGIAPSSAYTNSGLNHRFRPSGKAFCLSGSHKTICNAFVWN